MLSASTRSRSGASDNAPTARWRARYVAREASGLGHRRCALLLHAPGLALPLPQVVELRPADPGLLHHLDLLDRPRVQGEDPLHAVAEGDLAHGHGGPGAGAPQADDHALEDLHALALGLLGLALDLLLHRRLLDA